MTVERVVVIVAGTFIMLSLALSQLHHIYWLWFTAFVGLNLFQSGLTGFCPLAIILKKAGMPTNSQKAMPEEQLQTS
jgi:hypothetical protein